MVVGIHKITTSSPVTNVLWSQEHDPLATIKIDVGTARFVNLARCVFTPPFLPPG